MVELFTICIGKSTNTTLFMFADFTNVVYTINVIEGFAREKNFF